MSSPSSLYARQSAPVKQIQLAEKQQERQTIKDSKSVEDELGAGNRRDQGTARLVRNGTGKSVIIDHMLLLSQVSR